jgi:hypothetical protein
MSCVDFQNILPIHSNDHGVPSHHKLLYSCSAALSIKLCSAGITDSPPSSENVLTYVFCVQEILKDTASFNFERIIFFTEKKRLIIIQCQFVLDPLYDFRFSDVHVFNTNMLTINRI